VTYDPAFDSAWLKWGRAAVHMQALEADLDTFGPDGHRNATFTARAKYHPKRHGFGVYIESIDPIPPTWGLLLGDIANNLRSALDQVAWALVCKGSKPPGVLSDKGQKGVYFPICKDRDEFNGCLAVKLPGVGRAEIAKVRLCQPYKGRPARWRRFHPLTLLAKINASDKHRTVQPVWTIPIATEIEATHERDCTVHTREIKATRKPLEVGTELCLVRARKMGSDPHIEVQARIAAEPSFEGLVPMRTWLENSRHVVGLLLKEFSEPPRALFTLGINLNRWVRS
jgi:hypothetical protein